VQAIWLDECELLEEWRVSGQNVRHRKEIKVRIITALVSGWVLSAMLCSGGVAWIEFSSSQHDADEINEPSRMLEDLTAATASAPAALCSPFDDRRSPLDDKIAAVLPTPDEDRWLEIDWHANIAEARQEAERQNKPVLLWVMNGNPLGCG
jgi:hypothetical protein